MATYRQTLEILVPLTAVVYLSAEVEVDEDVDDATLDALATQTRDRIIEEYALDLSKIGEEDVLVNGLAIGLHSPRPTEATLEWREY